MKLKRLVRYSLNFDRKWLTASGVLMGLGFFLQALYHFTMVSIPDVSNGRIALFLILPMLMEAAWFLLLRGFKLNAPGLYGILGSLFAILLIVQTFVGGSTFSGLVALACLFVDSLALLAITGGFLRFRFAGVVVFLATIVLRLMFGGLEIQVLEAAALCNIAAMLAFFGGLEIPQKDRME